MLTKWTALGVLALLTSGFVLIWLYNFSINNPIDSGDEKRYIFTISSGEKPADIGGTLGEQGIIRSKLAFYIYMRVNKLDGKIRAGKFLLYKNQTIPEIVNSITDRNQGEISILIPEGYAIKDIDKTLTDLSLIEKDELIKFNNNSTNLSELKVKYSFLKKADSLEGYLFPDTYFVNPADFQIEAFIKRMLNNFKIKYEKDLQSDFNKTKRPLNQVIIMASIIEKEIRTAKDRTIAAGILWKRLDNDWLLGADATILYLKSTNVITKDDLEKNSPYNTRINKGLPPTPISNPGLESLKATLNPQETDYWYYLTPTNSDTVIYSKTNEEHNENKKKYLE